MKIKNRIINIIKFLFPNLSELLISKFTNIYNSYYDKHKCIYVHIPKAWGNSIIKTLFNSKSSFWHNKAIQYYINNSNKFNSYYKFTLTRNPYDRFLSAFLHLKKVFNKRADLFIESILLKDLNFKEFCLKIKNNNNYCKKILRLTHFIPQYKFIYDKKWKILLDYIWKLENIDSDIKEIQKNIDINIDKIEVLNKNWNKKWSFEEYYDNETKEIVYNLYKKDFNLLNYKK